MPDENSKVKLSKESSQTRESSTLNPQTPVPLPPVKSHWKPIAIIAVIISLISIIAAGYLYYQNSQQDIQQTSENVPSPTPTTTPEINTYTLTPSSMEGWQTYTDNIYGYSIDSPEDWYINPTLAEAAGKGGVAQIANYDLNGNTAPASWFKVEIGIYDRRISTNQTLEDWLENRLSSETNKQTIEKESLILANHTAIKFERENPAISTPTFIIQRENIVYFISAIITPSKGNIKTFEMMLDSFKFHDNWDSQKIFNPFSIDPITDWQTYTNQNYGYTLEYPQGWFIYPEGKAAIGGENVTAISNFDIENTIKQNESQIRVNIYTEDIVNSFEKYIEEEKPKDASLLISQKELVVNGTKSIELITQGLGINRAVYIPYKDRVYVVVGLANENTQSILDQILSTFRFLDE